MSIQRLEQRFTAALTLGQIFKILAIVSLLGGVVVSVEVVSAVQDEGGDVAAAVGYTTAATLLSAGFLAFFGYVIEILVAIADHTDPGVDDLGDHSDDHRRRAA